MNRTVDHVLEILYLTLMLFMLQVAYLTFIQWEPFAFTFQPPQDFALLRNSFMIILFGVSSVKLAIIGYGLMFPKAPEIPKISYTPANRKCI